MKHTEKTIETARKALNDLIDVLAEHDIGDDFDKSCTAIRKLRNFIDLIEKEDKLN